MGIYFTDKYSLLHLASGIVAQYWNISFTAWFILHAAFELVENTPAGIRVIQLIKLWPGGKSCADSLLNSLGDQFYACIGWALARNYFELFPKKLI
ncbi:MAG: hypothetical protein EBU84_17790 [Actinobacteria bacterium]|jgi:hypothetical protein|nr:hypothetical protein [Actinomycetota bacterium]